MQYLEHTHIKNIFEFYWNSNFIGGPAFHLAILAPDPGPGTQCAHCCYLTDFGFSHVTFLDQMNGSGCDIHHF